jgi:ribosomal protein S18 acetylase RimI-like enzyme
VHPVTKFRRATPNDAESILRFWRDSEATASTTDEVGHLRRVVEHPTTVFLLAVEDRDIVGSLIGAFDGWRGNMYRLVVRPDRRRQGIARQLVRQVEAIFSAWGVKRTSVLVPADVPGAREFWCAVGYPCDEHINRHVRTT